MAECGGVANAPGAMTRAKEIIDENAKMNAMRSTLMNPFVALSSTFFPTTHSSLPNLIADDFTNALAAARSSIAPSFYTFFLIYSQVCLT